MVKDQNILAEGTNPSTPTNEPLPEKENKTTGKETPKASSAPGNAKASGFIELYRGITALISGILQISNSLHRVNKARKKLQDIAKKDHVLLLAALLSASVLLAGSALVFAETLPDETDISVDLVHELSVDSLWDAGSLAESPQEAPVQAPLFNAFSNLEDDPANADNDAGNPDNWGQEDDDGWEDSNDDGWEDGDDEPKGNERTITIPVSVCDPEGNLWADRDPRWGLTLFPQAPGASPLSALLLPLASTPASYGAEFSVPAADSPTGSDVLRYTLVQTIGGELPGDEIGNPAIEYDPKPYTIDITFNQGYPVNFLILNETGEGADIRWINFPRFSRNIKLTKVKAGTDTALSGAVLQILKVLADGTEEPMTEYTTAALSHIITLPIGCDYIVREIKAPEGYAISPDAGFRINEDYSVTITDPTGTLRGASPLKTFLTYQDMPLAVTIQKVDEETKALLPGAVLSLIQKDTDALIQSWNSDQENTVLLSFPGTYILSETEAPQGYRKADRAEFIVHPDNTISVTENANGALTLEGHTLTLSNQKLPDSVPVRIQKVDERTGMLLSDADLSLYKKAEAENEEDTLLLTWTTDDQTLVSFDLKPGVYFLKEIRTPKGYRPCPQDLFFSISLDGTVTIAEDARTQLSCQDGQLTLENHPLTQICKTDSLTNDRLFGAQLALFRFNADGTIEKEPVHTWIDTEGENPFFDLSEGRWLLREQKAPAGYALAEDTEFFVDSQGAVSITNAGNGMLTADGTCLYLADHALCTAIRKTDIETGTRLSGANLELLFEEDQTVVHSWTSQSCDEMILLPSPGTYRLRELSAPDGYTAAGDTLFTVSTDGQITINPDSTTQLSMAGDVLVLTNRPKRVLQILKKAQDTNEMLPGAALSLYRISDGTKDRELLYSWVSSMEPFSAALDPGDYQLCETAAPGGFICAVDHTFTLTEEGQILPEPNQSELAADVSGTSLKLTLTDARDFVSLKLFKQDAETFTVLPGASLEILQINPVTGAQTPLYSFVSGPEANCLELPVGFRYRIRETDAPKGYRKAAETDFIVNTDHSLSIFGDALAVLDNDTLVLYDQPDRVEMSLLKLASDTKKALPGARLLITKEDVSPALPVADFVTATSPQPLHLSPGLYRIHEEEAPKGYSLCPDTFFILQENHTLELPEGTDPCLTIQDGLLLTLTDRKTPEETIPPETTTAAPPETTTVVETTPEETTAPVETTAEETTTPELHTTEEETTTSPQETTLPEESTMEETTTVPEETQPSETPTQPVETTEVETSSEEAATSQTETETTQETTHPERPSESTTTAQESTSGFTPVLGIEDSSPAAGIVILLAGLLLLLLALTLLLAMMVSQKSQ